MGIKSINEFLKEKSPTAYIIDTLSKFGGYRIAIDGYNYLYTIMCSANKSVIYKTTDLLADIPREPIVNKARHMLIIFILQFMANGIIPVFVWDGTPLEEKKECKIKRKKDKDDVIEKISILKSKLEMQGPLFRSKQDMDKLRQHLSQCNSLQPGEVEHFQELVSSLGFPSLRAEFEGEQLCSSLAREGLVAGVWSTDTDNYALGTPILISGFDSYDSDGNVLVEITDLRQVLKDMDKSHNFLVDLCIMCGCDFNQRIPRIGPANAFKLLEKHGSLDMVIENEKDKPTHMLKHDVCRRLFAYQPSKLTENELNFSYSTFTENISSIIDQYDLEDHRQHFLTQVRKIAYLLPKTAEPFLPSNPSHNVKKKSRLVIV
jgi:flap endonuclease-1